MCVLSRELFGYISTDLLTSNKDYAIGPIERTNCNYILKCSQGMIERKAVCCVLKQGRWSDSYPSVVRVNIWSEKMIRHASIKEAKSINHVTHWVEANHQKLSYMIRGGRTLWTTLSPLSSTWLCMSMSVASERDALLVVYQKIRNRSTRSITKHMILFFFLDTFDDIDIRSVDAQWTLHIGQIQLCIISSS